MKRVFVILLATIFIAVGAVVVFIATLNLNAYKPQIIKAVKDSSGLDLSIDGKISLSFSPVGLSVNDIKIANPNMPQKTPFATLKSFEVAFELMPLLKKEVKVKYLQFSDGDIKILKYKDGKINAIASSKSADSKQVSRENQKPMPAIMADQIILKNIDITYDDLGNSTRVKVRKMDVLLENISLSNSDDVIKAVMFEGNLDIKEVSYDKHKMSDIEAVFGLKDAVFDISKLEYTIFNSRASGSAKVEMALNTKVSIKNKISKLDVGVATKELNGKEIFKGFVDTDISLSFIGNDAKSIKQSLGGKITLSGQDIGLQGYDLDKILEQYNKSQNLDVKDMGSFLVAGPLGLLASKSYDGANLSKSIEGGATTFKQVHVEADISDGVVTLSDVAISTEKNRVALKGGFDIVSEKIMDVQVGILDNAGCAKYQQTVQGTFSKPSVKIDKVAVESVVNIATSLFGKIKGNEQESKQQTSTCKAFYDGVVKHP
ncbi:MAG: AsmA family protein [Sulfurospirillaceae bacterium]|nr:AsmA family protein [Sulfurospirillaceae bacterium]MDD3462650.1 AsmA family protein [Sulfurospirillaceae bacterium]